MRRELIVAAALAASAAGVAACGGGSTASSGSAGTAGGMYSQAAGTKSTTTADAARLGAVKVSTTKLGRILTDRNGRTLYLFEKDKGAASNCSGACASIWPPLAAATGGLGHGVSAAKLGSIKRADGKTEATYAGHPLYTYVGDAKPGDTRGEGLDQFGAKWYVLASSGQKIDND